MRVASPAKLDCFTYVTYARLAADTDRLVSMLPPGIDVVVGIARSGMLPATQVAMALHRPLYAIAEERVTPLGGGHRMKNYRSNGRHRIVIVDDTTASGQTIQEALPWVRVAFPGSEVLTAAIYCMPQSIEQIDFPVVELPPPHYLEWNFFNSVLSPKAAYDLDGILCHDVPVECDDDGERYINYLRNAPPMHLPRKAPIPAIVTARLAKYEQVTRDWLARWKVRFHKLIVGPWPSMRERSKAQAISRWKAEQYKQLQLGLFVESDRRQAVEIAPLAGKPVLCPKAGRVFLP